MIIACGYKKRVGKDTFYEIVKELYPDRKVKRIAFADALKNEVFEMFLKPIGLDKSILDDPEKKPIVRPVMQGWGSVRRELCDPNWWVDRAFDQVSEEPESIDIFTDERYLNENKKVREMGGVSVLILRDSVADPSETHSSETELDPYHHLFDYTIVNNGTMEEYKAKVKELMDSILSEEKQKLSIV